MNRYITAAEKRKFIRLSTPDYILIAQRSGATPDYAYKVLTGRAACTGTKATRVIKEANKYVA